MAQAASDTPADVASSDSEAVSVTFKLRDIKNCQPLTLQFKQEDLMKDVIKTLDKSLEINDDSLKYCGKMKTERSFSVQVGKQDVIDFDNNKFIISSKTRLVQYWNDLLYLSKELTKKKENELKEDEKEDFYMKYDGPLTSSLEGNGDRLQIGDVSINFHRTLRIPDNDKQYPLPPSLGSFKMVKIQDYIGNDGLPSHWEKRKGVLLPMWQKEVQCLFALLVFF